jgi:predicted phosphoribosyltransferase
MLVGRKIGHPFHREFVVGALAEDEALFFCLYDNWRLMGFERLSAPI